MDRLRKRTIEFGVVLGLIITLFSFSYLRSASSAPGTEAGFPIPYGLYVTGSAPQGWSISALPLVADIVIWSVLMSLLLLLVYWIKLLILARIAKS